MMIVRFIVLFITEIFLCCAYKHIIYMHGILSGPSEADGFIALVEKAHPGTNVTVIDMYNYKDSLEPMWKQVMKLKQIVKPIMDEHPEGVHFVCFSQGGLICRGVLSDMKHNVHNFISLSAPQAGQYGDTVYLKYFFPHFLKETIYKYFYSEHGQRWSIANYWHDPHEEKLYRQYSKYLAVLDNDNHAKPNQEYKANFLRLKNLVLIGGQDDRVITPWQSSMFGFYNQNETVVDMKHQEFYLKDYFGLKTLDERKAIHKYEVRGVEHVFWYRNKTVFDCCVKQWLD